MTRWECTPTRVREISKAMVHAATARLRGIGALPTAVDWTRRAATCERCPLRIVHRGVSYCGTPFLQHVDRDPSIDGCGCPTRDKARSPGEHCPLDTRHRPAEKIGERCTCKWCENG
jgi:hypothetical protein